MRLKLFLTLKGVQYYGYIPYIEDGEDTTNRIEDYELSEEDENLLDEDFINPIDKLCNALIDPYDVDYLNADQCKLMLTWLQQRIKKPMDPRLEEIYHKLIEYANKAIELNTGIVFDL